MVRLTRAQQQERTRAAVLAAAEAEFTERGYAAAKVDEIAERAELTRGAVYSNFPSKRALYLAVLVDMVERAATAEHSGTAERSCTTEQNAIAESDTTSAVPQPPTPSAGSITDALGAFARTWLERMPLADGTPSFGRVHLRSPAGVLDDEPIRDAFGQVTHLEALLLALALESYAPADAPSVRQVRRAQLVLRLLEGPGASADPALGFGDPFDIVQACAHLGGLALADTWNPPHLPYVPPARACRDRWSPPQELQDLITHRPVGFAEDGVITLLGTNRLKAAEEAVRAARTGDRITVVVTTADPAETGRFVQLRAGDFARCLRRVFEPGAWPRLRLVLDERGLLASAVGVPDADDATEYAVRVQHGTIVTRAQGPGAAHGAATFDLTTADVSHTAPDGAAP
ncbi:helix-turn-helix domain-containing protein [Streptomyces sp. NBC_01618]|uniref:helix-turn-helix domain-containing protein n=1 Tax=Streptomyces sp. NBC_01618 TaxID=2975900 RepID=UPI0038661D0D|nr:TetR/AcrR family transcriptional regulator [Streptomyces sp. NBC_01618]